MMTRKDYVETSKILADFRDSLCSSPEGETDFEGLVYRFSVMFAEDNARFDSRRFEDACFGED
jgi:hypothetical protein